MGLDPEPSRAEPVRGSLGAGEPARSPTHGLFSALRAGGLFIHSVVALYEHSSRVDGEWEAYGLIC